MLAVLFTTIDGKDEKIIDVSKGELRGGNALECQPSVSCPGTLSWHCSAFLQSLGRETAGGRGWRGAGNRLDEPAGAYQCAN